VPANDTASGLRPGLARLSFSLPTGQVEAEIRLPPGSVRLKDLLPLLQSLDDAIVNAAASACVRQGHRITCVRGCGACCHLLISIAEAEAWHLRAVLDNMPHKRRSAILQRFEEAWARLAAAGLLTLLETLPLQPDATVATAGADYARLRVACPFLEDGLCAIYAERPMRCREHLVVSPSEECWAMSPGTIDSVEVAGRLSRALMACDGDTDRQGGWVPLILAPRWAAEHTDCSRPRPAADIVREVLGKV